MPDTAIAPPDTALVADTMPSPADAADAQASSAFDATFTITPRVGCFSICAIPRWQHRNVPFTFTAIVRS